MEKRSRNTLIIIIIIIIIITDTGHDNECCDTNTGQLSN